MHKGPSINDVSNWEVEGSKTGQNCRRIVLKNYRHWGGVCQKSGKIADVVYGWSLTKTFCYIIIEIVLGITMFYWQWHVTKFCFRYTKCKKLQRKIRNENLSEKKGKKNKVYWEKKDNDNQFWLLEKALRYTKNIIQNDINTYLVNKCLILLSTSKAYDMMM